MIGWRRCSDCECVDEDDCERAPQNVHLKKQTCPYTGNCRCQEKMGNDFWFLPTGSCLYRKPT